MSLTDPELDPGLRRRFESALMEIPLPDRVGRRPQYAGHIGSVVGVALISILTIALAVTVGRSLGDFRQGAATQSAAERGFVICGGDPGWVRPSVGDQNAKFASDPRYQNLRADGDSPEATLFRQRAYLSDGRSNSGRTYLMLVSGLWSDLPSFRSQINCPPDLLQVWLIGYEPVSYEREGSGAPHAVLNVRAAAGYKIIGLLGPEPGRVQIVDGSTSIIVLDWVPDSGEDPGEP